MRQRGVSVLVVALLAGLSKSTVVGDDLADLKAAHAQALKAIATSDANLWLAMFHEEQVRFDRGTQMFTDFKGMDREALRKGIADGAGGTESYAIKPVDVHYRVIGDTGIVWGHNVDLYKARNAPGTVQLSRFTAVYSRSGGKWRRVCTHVSAVPGAD